VADGSTGDGVASAGKTGDPAPAEGAQERATLAAPPLDRGVDAGGRSWILAGAGLMAAVAAFGAGALVAAGLDRRRGLSS
jgi:hypothetical protein